MISASENFGMNETTQPSVFLSVEQLLIMLLPRICTAMIFFGGLMMLWGMIRRISGAYEGIPLLRLGLMHVFVGLTFPYVISIGFGLSTAPMKPIRLSVNLDWSLIGTVIIGTLALIFVLANVYFAYIRISGAQASKRQCKLERKRLTEELNRSSVQGLDYAERNERVSLADIRTLPPQLLQEKIDRDNLHCWQIADVLGMLRYYSGNELSAADERRRDELTELLREMREQPEEVQRKALASHADHVIAASRQAVQSVRDTPEG